MTIQKTDLDRRETRRRTETLYSHQRSKEERAERERKPDATDALRRRHHEEHEELVQKHHRESVKLASDNQIELDKHERFHSGVKPPAEMTKRHETEREALSKSHDKKREALATRHRLERDRVFSAAGR